MKYRRLPIEVESPEERGYDTIRYNLTESSFSDARLADFDLSVADLLLCYGDHRGLPELRERLASGAGVAPSDVLVTPGAAAALFFVHTALLEPGDRAVIVAPNYATNLETPSLIGVDLVPCELTFEQGFRLDLDRLAALITPGTRLVSLTTPHNPSGVAMDERELRAVVRLCEERGVTLLVDETYREMRFAGPLPVAASLSPNVVSVSSLSKTWGLPGLRIGWIVAQDPALMERFLAAKEQVVITNSIVDETLAARFLARHAEHTAAVRATIARRFEVTRAFMAKTRWFEWVEPSGGVVAFPRLVAGVDPDAFHAALNRRGTFVGPGHWFGWSDRYFRLGFGWPNDADLAPALATLDDAAAEAAG